MKISEDDFFEKYNPQINHIVREQEDKSVADEDICSWGGCMYETYGAEDAYIRSLVGKRTVWTIIEGDNDSTFILAGYHLVNRMGYLVTEKEWENVEDEVNIDC